MVTGKNKEQFKKFYGTINGGNYKILYQNFMAYPFEMQIGVYLAYYDSAKFLIRINPADSWGSWVWEILAEDCMSPFYIVSEADKKYNTRTESYKEAFKQANELMNSN